MGRPIRPVVIAHRGASGYLPEHTLPAKALAYAMGADYLEQDIVATADDELIVIHDAILNLTTDVAERYPDRARDDGYFYARDFTMDEIRTLDVHERTDPDGNPAYPERYPIDGDTFKIHTLGEELTFIAHLQASVGRPVGIYPEIKHPAMHHEAGVDITALVLAELENHGYTGRDDAVYLQCFDDAEVRRIRHELDSELKLVQLIGENDWGESPTDYDSMRTAAGLKELAKTVDGIGPWIPQLYNSNDESDEIRSTGLVKRAHAAGLAVHPYTLRRDSLPPKFESFDALLCFLCDELQVDGIFTDFPDLAVNACGRSHSDS